MKNDFPRVPVSLRWWSVNKSIKSARRFCQFNSFHAVFFFHCNYYVYVTCQTVQTIKVECCLLCSRHLVRKFKAEDLNSKSPNSHLRFTEKKASPNLCLNLLQKLIIYYDCIYLIWINYSLNCTLIILKDNK